MCGYAAGAPTRARRSERRSDHEEKSGRTRFHQLSVGPFHVPRAAEHSGANGGSERAARTRVHPSVRAMNGFLWLTAWCASGALVGAAIGVHIGRIGAGCAPLQDRTPNVTHLGGTA